MIKKILMQKIFLLATCYLLLATFTGCGYTTHSMVSSRFKTISVVPFINKIDITRETDVGTRYKIYHPMLETDITKKVINKFLTDGNLKVVKSESADLTLKGELVEFRKDPIRYTDNDEVEEYRMNIAVNISLWDNQQNELRWQENNFTGDYTYFTSFTTQNVTTKTDAQAIVEAIDDLARRIVERTVEEW